MKREVKFSALLVICSLMISLLGCGSPVKNERKYDPANDIRLVVFGSFGDQTLGEAVDSVMTGVKQSFHLNPEGDGIREYLVKMTGTALEYGSEIELNFGIDYMGDDSSGFQARLDSVSVNGKEYSDSESLGIILAWLYGQDTYEDLGNTPSQPDEPADSGIEDNPPQASIDTEKLANWLNEKLQAKTVEISEDEKAECKSIGEDQFYSVWQNVVLEQFCAYDNNEMDSASQYMNRAKVLYEEIFGTQGNVASLGDKIDSFGRHVETLSELGDKYDFDLNKASSNYTQGSFYVYQRMKYTNSDGLLGELINSLGAIGAEEWIAYNVEYSYGDSYPGDRCYVLRSESDNTFSEMGVYEISYFNTGETTELTDGQGFTKTVPVYQIVEDPYTFENDIRKYNESYNQMMNRYDKIIDELAVCIYGYKGAAFLGHWLDINSGMCYARISPSSGKTFKVTIQMDSFVEPFTWTMSAKFDTQSNKLTYSDCVKTRAYTTDNYGNITDESETVLYRNGSGELYIDKSGYLNWVDNEENEGSYYLFQK